MNRYHFFIIVAAILWGVDGLLRSSLYSLPPTVIVFWEHLIGSLFLFGFLRIQKRSILQTKNIFENKKVARALVLISLMSGVIGTVAFTAALGKTNYIPISVVFLIQKLQPVFTIIAAYAYLHEKPKRSFAPWALLALAAGFFMTFPNGTVIYDYTPSYIQAAGLALLAAFAWGTSTVFSRYALINTDLGSTTFGRFILTTLFAFVAVFVFQNQGSLLAIQMNQIATLCLIALSTGMVALYIYYRGLQKVPAYVSCILELAFPLTGLVIDTIQHKTLAPSQYIAAFVLAFAAYQIARTQSPDRS